MKVKFLFFLLMALCLNACQSTDKKAEGSQSSEDFTKTAEHLATAKSMSTTLDSTRCYGTEPFWSLVILEKDSSITFNNVGVEIKYAFPYLKPKIENDSWIYETNAGANTLKATMKKEKCSDGMSDIEHAYASEVVLNGKKYSGCGSR